MSDRVTYAEAARLLGCHVSNVAKLIARGQLNSSGKRGGSFCRTQVEELAKRRAEEREARATRLRGY